MMVLVRDYIHVTDLAEGHLASIDYIIKDENLEINLGTGEGFSVLDVVKKTEIISNKKINYVISERKAGIRYCYIIFKSKSTIGWYREGLI